MFRSFLFVFYFFFLHLFSYTHACMHVYILSHKRIHVSIFFITAVVMLLIQQPSHKFRLKFEHIHKTPLSYITRPSQHYLLPPPSPSLFNSLIQIDSLFLDLASDFFQLHSHSHSPVSSISISHTLLHYIPMGI